MSFVFCAAFVASIKEKLFYSSKESKEHKVLKVKCLFLLISYKKKKIYESLQLKKVDVTFQAVIEENLI